MPAGFFMKAPTLKAKFNLNATRLLRCLYGPHDFDGVLDSVEVDRGRREGTVLLQTALPSVATARRATLQPQIVSHTH